MPRRRISVTARRPSLFCVYFLRMGAGQCRKTARGEKNLSLLPKTPGRPESGGPEPRPPPKKKKPWPWNGGRGSLGGLHAPRLRGARFVFVSFFFVLFSCLVGACFVLSCLFSIPCAGRGGNRAESTAGRCAEGKGEGKTGRARSNAHRRAAQEPSGFALEARCFGAPWRPLRPRRAWRSKAARQGSHRGRKPRRPAPCPQPPSGSQARMALRLWHKRWGRTKAADSRQARRASARSAGACRGLQAGSRAASRRRRASTGMSQRQMPKRGSAQTPRR